MHAPLLMLLARSVERCSCDFDTQDLTSAAWAFAEVGRSDAPLFRALVLVAKQGVGRLTMNARELRAMVWALSRCETLTDALRLFDHERLVGGLAAAKLIVVLLVF